MMRFALAVEQKHEPVPQVKSNGEDKSMRHSRYDEDTEAQPYIRVPVWLIVMMSSILITLCGTIFTTIWFAATIKSDVSNLSQKIDGSVSTSMQNQINELKTEVESNKERTNQLRLDMARKGVKVIE